MPDLIYHSPSFKSLRFIIFEFPSIQLSSNDQNPEIDDWAIRQEIVVGDMDSWTYEPYLLNHSVS